MERKSVRRKLRRKYKRYAAAVAGAAILSGAVLPGIPAAKALAAESPTPAPPTKIEQSVDNDAHKSMKQLIAEKTKNMRESKHRGHGVDKQTWYKYYHRGNHDRYDHERNVYRGDGVIVRSLSSPVDFVKARASYYGFDAARDTFTFLSLSTKTASVQVTKHDTGERFRVDLERGYYRDWKIVAVRSIISY